MEPKKQDRTLTYIGISIALIIAGIFVTGLINRIKQSRPEDIRAKAGTTASLQFVGVVVETNTNTNVLTVTNLHFADNTQQNYGTWTITPPQSYSLTQAIPGASVKLAIDPTTFNIESHTAVAREITKK